MVITTNMPALNAWGKNRTAGVSMEKSLEKLSSGYRINRAADDAAGLSISEKMRAQITGLNRSGLNVADGKSLINTADGALATINDMFKRADELCLAAANGTIGTTERQAISAELSAITEEVDRIAQATRFNEIPVFQYTKLLTSTQQVLEDVAHSITMNPIPPSVLPASKALTAPVPCTVATLKLPFTPAGPTLADALDGKSLTFQTSATPPVSKTITFTATAPAGPGQILLDKPGDPISDAAIDAELRNMVNSFRPDLRGLSFAAGEITFTHNNVLGRYMGNPISGMKSGNGAQISGFAGSGTFAGGIDGVPLNASIDFGPLTSPADIAALHQTSFTVDCGSCSNIISRIIFLDSTRYTGPPIAPTTTTGSITTHNLVVDLSAVNTAEDLVANIAANWRTPHLTDFSIDPSDPKKLVAHRNDLQQSDPAFVKSSTQALNWTQKEWVEKPVNTEVPASLTIFVASLPHQEFISLRLPHFNAQSLGLEANVQLTSAEQALQYQEKVHKADQTLTAARANLGADYNRLSSTGATLEQTHQNMQDAESRIRDLDMAKEYTKFVAASLLIQSSGAMLAQANNTPKAVLSLLSA